MHKGKISFLCKNEGELSILNFLHIIRFAVQGIPSFVVLDSISGNIVVTKEQSRSEVMMASQRGEDAIKDLFERNWLERIPPESKVSETKNRDICKFGIDRILTTFFLVRI